ncbi:hypothetical protein PN36_04145 [Candidatus Thiomargarita nelsonii]|uniref:CHAT domain-containing protein n=1 Tax=Candidatus Thiomargarita nelsonii TaxID=1003181 RepID=A0A0A6PC81_9GAMM|nr:hypothetical protein PN36_04145 [Candidatus Thiomargarita nelsonii]
MIGRSSKALPLSEKAYRLRKEVLGAMHPSTLTSLIHLARIYQKPGKIHKAIKHFEKIVTGVEHLNAIKPVPTQGGTGLMALVEHLRSGGFSPENRQALFKEWVSSYFRLSYLYAKQSRLDDAFRLAELSKARTLLESLAAKHAAQESGLSKAEQQKLQNYETRLADFNDKIGKALNEKVRLETDKNQLIADLNKFERKLKAKYPKYAELSDVQILSAKNGAKHLSKNAVLISYLVESNLVLAFTFESNGKLTAHDLGKIQNLKKDLESYRYQMSRDKTRSKFDMNKKDKKDIKKLSIELSKRLLEPLKNIIKDKSHWIISPSGVLALIPFETLRFEGEEQPVIDQHKVSYVQSLSILAMLQKRDLAYKQIKNRGNLFAMGAPIYQKAGKSSKKAKQLKAGKGQIEALTATKREFLKKGGKYANPRYWAMPLA